MESNLIFEILNGVHKSIKSAMNTGTLLFIFITLLAVLFKIDKFTKDLRKQVKHFLVSRKETLDYDLSIEVLLKNEEATKKLLIEGYSLCNGEYENCVYSGFLINHNSQKTLVEDIHIGRASMIWEYSHGLSFINVNQNIPLTNLTPVIKGCLENGYYCADKNCEVFSIKNNIISNDFNYIYYFVEFSKSSEGLHIPLFEFMFCTIEKLSEGNLTQIQKRLKIALNIYKKRSEKNLYENFNE